MAAGRDENVATALEPELATFAGGSQEIHASEGIVEATQCNFQIERAELERHHGAKADEGVGEGAQGIGWRGEECRALEVEFGGGCGE